MSRKQYINFVDGQDAPYSASFNEDRGAGPNRFFAAVLDVTAVAGTAPTLSVQFQEFDEASGKWINVGTLLTQNGIGTSNNEFNVNSERIRAAIVIGGTAPEYTFTLGASTAPN